MTSWVSPVVRVEAMTMLRKCAKTVSGERVREHDVYLQRFGSRRSQLSGVAPQSQRGLEMCSSASRVVPAPGTAKGTAPSWWPRA